MVKVFYSNDFIIVIIHYYINVVMYNKILCFETVLPEDSLHAMLLICELLCQQKCVIFAKCVKEKHCGKLNPVLSVIAAAYCPVILESKMLLHP